MLTVRNEIRRAVLSPRFIAVVIAFSILIIIQDFSTVFEVFDSREFRGYEFHITFLINALKKDGFMFMLPVFSSLVYTSSFMSELKNGFIKSYLPRTKQSPYISGKLASSAVSGFLVVFISIMLSEVFCYYLFRSKEYSAYSDASQNGIHMSVLVMSALRCSFIGMLSAVFGLTMSLVFMNQYMAFASPFIMHYILIIINERYYDSLYVFYPAEWIRPSHVWPGGDAGLIAFIVCLAGAVSMIYWFIASRRLQDV